MANDPPDRMRTEEALRLSEARFAGILAIAADAIIAIDEQMRITLFNEGAERTFGYGRGEVIGKPLDILIPERFRKNHGEHVGRFAAATTPARRMGERQEIFGLHKSGREFSAEASISKLEVGGERTFTVVLRDVSERKAREAALRESERRLWAFLNTSTVIGWMKDEDGRYVFVSGNFQHRFGPRFATCIGRNDFDLWPRDVAVLLRQSDRDVLEQDHEVERVKQLPNADGSISSWLIHKFPFRTASGRRHVGGLAVDITERVKAEEALARSNAVLETRVEERTRELREEMSRHEEAQSAVMRLQRMEALGQLTGGIAHDFNNLLTVISGNLQLMGIDVEDPRLRKYLEEAERAVEMGARLNQRLMTFAKQRRLAPMAVNLNDQVIGVRELLRRSLGETVTLTAELAEDLWTVRVDPSEVENALVNLAINARDAMPEGGKLTVTTHNVTVTERDAVAEAGLSPGSYVLVSVKDTGVGMSAEVQARAFEPFFTTKGHGKGTGLGLATIYGFVKQSGGHVTLRSGVGQGTTVNIYLPRIEPGSEVLRTENGEVSTPSARGETILVVEDNPDVRRVTVERLRAIGFGTLEAGDGPAAIEILGAGARVDLVFSDVVMPGGISGFDLAREIAKRWPTLKVLLTSGYAPEDVETAGAETTRPDILGKPYSQTALERAIWKTIRGSGDQTRVTSAAKT